MSRCVQVCSPWHDIHDKLHLNLELASTYPVAQFQTLQDVKPNNLAPSSKIHTAYLGINTVCTEQLQDICTISDYKLISLRVSTVPAQVKSKSEHPVKWNY